MKKSIAASAFVSALLSGAVFPVAAQEAAGSGGIEEVTVTAQRVAESAQRAAIAVSTLTDEELRNAGVTRVQELTNIVPALQVATAAGPYSLWYLRGVGNFNGNALSDSTVAFNFDNVYIGRPSSVTGFFYDLERVEVVKGPQGTLYGRNATGGAVNVISRLPQLGVFEGNVSAEVGNESAFRVDGAVNIPAGDKAAVRLAGIHVEHDGYMNDGTDDQDDWAGRATFRIDPNDNLRIVVVADYFDQGGKGPGSTVLGAPHGAPFGAPSFSIDDRVGFFSHAGQAYYTSQPNQLNGRNFAPMDFKPFQDNNYWGISSTIDWTTSIGTVTFIPAYREGHLDYQSATPGFLIRQVEDSDQTSFELRLASDDSGPLRYQVGAYYFNESIDDPLAAYNHQSNISLQELSAETSSEAVFGRLTYAFSDAFRLTAGARWTHEEKDFSGTLVAASRICLAGLFACPTAEPFPYDVFTPPAPDFNPAPDGTITVLSPIDETGPNARDAAYNRVTWRVGADWDVTENNFLYASYETGFKAGGFFFSHDAGVYKPESIEAYTVGSKNRFMDRRLQVNLELFYWKYRDQQISHLGFDSSGTAIFPTENVGAATMKGAELEIQFLPWDNTLLSADFQYLDAEYNDFIYTKPNLNGGFDNGTACPNAAAPALVYTIDCSGFTPPYSPKWTVNLGIQQTFPLGNGANIVALARMHYQSKTLTGLEFLEEETQDAYATLDASLTYAAPEDRYFVSAFINNAFDETVIGNSFPTPFSFFVTGSIRPPRTYGLRAGYRF